MTNTELELAIRDVLESSYDCCYTGTIKVLPLKRDNNEIYGYTVKFYLIPEKPIVTTFEVNSWEEFVDKIRKDLEERRLDGVEYYKGIKTFGKDE